MNFDTFKSNLNILETAKLGGLEAQFKLAPELRKRYDADKIRQSNPKKAAVLALFYPNINNQTTFLLTERATYKGTHSAQISFPGGKIDKTDANLKATALREAYEEVGLHPSEIEVIRELTDVFIPPSNFLATPFLGFVNTKPVFKKNYEVAQTIEVLLEDLLNDNTLTTKALKTSYMNKIDVPCFKLNNYIVWGATAMMLSEIKELFNSTF
ncbi:NUDIX hydrolase [Polaribacter sp.]|uniref:NUDIX hydrolase n=1 Tax=Polaribacter sp. TaxID=1920175 RepID=UPI003F6BA08A